MTIHRVDRSILEQCLRSGKAYNPTFSADGQRLAFLSDITGVPQVWEVSSGGGSASRLTFTTEPVGSSTHLLLVSDRSTKLSYSPVADELVVAIDKGGDEHYQLVRVAEWGSVLEDLSRHPYAMHHLGGWSPDGCRFAFSANRRDSRYFDVYVRDMATGVDDPVCQEDSLIQPVAWTPDGTELAVLRLRTYLDADLCLLRLSDRKARRLAGGDGETYFVSPCFTPDGRSLYVATNLHREFSAMLRCDLSIGAWTPVVEGQWDVEEVALSRDGRFLAYTVNVGGPSELRLLDVAAAAHIRVPPLPAGVCFDLTWSQDGGQLAFVIDGPRHPMNVWVLDVAQKNASRVTTSARVSIPEESLVEPVLVTCRSFDGLEVPAWLYLPPGASVGSRYPAVVHVHGGPELQARPRFDGMVQCLALGGCVVLAPNIRGSTGYGRTYTHLDDQRKRWDAVADLKACRDWLVEVGWADSRRMAIMGASYGGFMVMAAITTFPELWAAGINIMGFADLEKHLGSTHPHRRRIREVEYGFLDQDATWMRTVSPIYHLERVRAALMLIHGVNDPRVSARESDQIATRLRDLGRDVEYLRFDDEGHGLAKLVNQIKGYGSALTFLARHLGLEFRS